jgi:hypothetical protein
MDSRLKEESMPTIKLKAKFDTDSRKGKYHRYQVGAYGDEYMGMLYIRTDMPVTPKEFEVELQLKAPAKVRNLPSRGGS